MIDWNVVSRSEGIRAGMSSTAWRLAKRAFALFAVFALAYFAWQSRGTLMKVVASAKPGWLVVSVLMWMMLHLISPWFTQFVLRARSLRLDYSIALKIHAGRLPAKYLPGGIWHTVARAGDYHAHGLSGRRVAWYLLIENYAIAAVTLALGGLITGTVVGIGPGWKMVAAACSAIGLCSLLALPLILARSPWPAAAFSSLANYAAGVVVMTVYWITAGAAFVVYVNSFQDLALANSALEIGGIYIFAWSIGFLTLIAPQGIGVSELVGGHLLQGNLAVTGLLALLAGFRAVMLVGDLVTWLLSFLVSDRKAS